MQELNSGKSRPGLKIDRLMLKKYDRPGPRYTSYPTVPEWSGEFTTEDYLGALDGASSATDPLSMYVHIPFCKSRCYYCGCNTCIDRGDDKPGRYIDALAREIKMIGGRLGRRNNLIQLHWGGGTPTYLDEKQIEQLFEAIIGNFTLEDDAEVAIEVDPRVTSIPQLELLRRLGFNRISLGVQDLTPQVQKAIGRDQTLEQTEELFDHSRRLGFGGINIDLIYGLPLQTVRDFSATIDHVVRMGADRVAVYSYAHLPSLKAHQRKIKETNLPGPEQKFELFATAVERFLTAGYIQIGMDHFARPDDELAQALDNGTLHRNFMGYTTKRTGDMLGVGMSAIGNISGAFAQNLSGLDSYMNTIGEGKPAIYRGYQLSRDDHIRQAVIISIMCNFVLKFDDLKKAFGIDYFGYFRQEDEELEVFIGDGLMKRTGNSIEVCPEGRIFVRNIAMVFDAYLRKRRDGDKPLFSRTI